MLISTGMTSMALMYKPVFNAYDIPQFGFVLFFIALQLIGLCVVWHDFEVQRYLRFERKAQKFIGRAKNALFFFPKIDLRIAIILQSTKYRMVL